jgi:hypothetical protein
MIRDAECCYYLSRYFTVKFSAVVLNIIILIFVTPILSFDTSHNVTAHNDTLC